MKHLALAAIAALAVSPVLAHEGLVHDGCDPAATVTAGDLTISRAFTRATLPNARTGGGYFTITNAGTAPDQLTGGSTEASQRTELHQMSVDAAGMMKMGELESGIEVPAGGSVSLEPGGVHVMFLGIGTPFTEGQCVALTLTFEKAGEVPVNLFIADPAADAAPGHAGH